MSFLYGFPQSLPRLICHSLRVNQAWTYGSLAIMRTRGTEERILLAQFEVLVETGEKEKLFFCRPNKTEDGRWNSIFTQSGINYAVTGKLIPKVNFWLKGRGLSLAICYNLTLLSPVPSSLTHPPCGGSTIHKALTWMHLSGSGAPGVKYKCLVAVRPGCDVSFFLFSMAPNLQTQGVKVRL